MVFLGLNLKSTTDARFLAVDLVFIEVCYQV